MRTLPDSMYLLQFNLFPGTLKFMDEETIFSNIRANWRNLPVTIVTAVAIKPIEIRSTRGN